MARICSGLGLVALTAAEGGGAGEPQAHTLDSYPGCWSRRGTPQRGWVTKLEVSGTGRTVVTDTGRASFNDAFAACPAVRYTRNGFTHSVYVRTSAVPSGFDAYDVFTNTWASASNEIHHDFEIYSTEADVANRRHGWSYCNYDDAGVGYPRDCGESGPVANQWFGRFSGRHASRGLYNGARFEVWSGPGCPSSAGTPPPQGWVTKFAVSGNGETVVADVGRTAFNEAFAACPAVRYTRNGLTHSIYVRTSAVPSGFDAYDLFTNTWSSDNNHLNDDFLITNSEMCLGSGRTSGCFWSFCNYDDPDVGYPRDCGKSGPVYNQWFGRFSGQHPSRGLYNGASFAVWNKNQDIGYNSAAETSEQQKLLDENTSDVIVLP